MSILHWDEQLAYTISPKSGPLRRMETLLDANQAVLNDLPKGFLKRPYWRVAAQLLALASETGSERDIREVTEALLDAVEREGWMTRATPVRE
jgi:hypothetical protein